MAFKRRKEKAATESSAKIAEPEKRVEPEPEVRIAREPKARVVREPGATVAREPVALASEPAPSASEPAPPGDAEQYVREHAYLLWKKHGEPHGRHEEHWYEAERVVHAKS
jgi:hypothetical protein